MMILRLVSLAQDDNLRLEIIRKLSNLTKHPLFSGSAIMVLGSNTINALNYLYHLILGRMLGPSDYGELAALISLMGLLSIVPGSISLVIIKHVSSAKTEEEVISLINWLKSKIIKGSLIFFLVILLLSPLIRSFLHINKLVYLALIAISFLISFQSLFYRSILQGLLKFKAVILSILTENSAKLILSILLVYLGFRVGGAMLAFVVAAVLGWYITIFYLKFSSKGKSDISPDVKSMTLFAIPVIIQTFSTTSFYSSDVILVKHFFSAHEAGIYAALSTLGKIIFFGTGPIAAVMFPVVSKKLAKGENFKRVYHYSFFATLTLAALILLFYLFTPKLAINLLYGRAYLEAADLLFWMGMFITLFSLTSLIVSYGLAVGRTTIVYFQLIAAISQIILIWFFHQTLFEVIIISCTVTGMLLIVLLIYSSYGDKPSFSHRSNVQTRKNNS